MDFSSFVFALFSHDGPSSKTVVHFAQGPPKLLLHLLLNFCRAASFTLAPFDFQSQHSLQLPEILFLQQLLPLPQPFVLPLWPLHQQGC